MILYKFNTENFMQLEYVFNGKPDGIGNRIEQLIYLQEFCEKNNIICYYIWNNQIVHRTYEPMIEFNNIIIVTDKQYLKCGLPHIKINEIQSIRTKYYIPIFKFKFNIEIEENYDCIIHVRGTDRLEYESIGDFSNPQELNELIKKTINFVNKNNDIQTFAIVSDDEQYKKQIINNINKKHIQLHYYENIMNDWADYYYLTKPNKFIIMCSKFSSFSITASIISNKKLLIFSNCNEKYK